MHNDIARIEKQTGYRNILVALDAYKRKQEPNAAWYCIEIIRPMVGGVVSNYVRYARMLGVGSVLSEDDLIQEAYSYLIKALSNFVPPDYAVNDADACARSWNRYANLVIKSPLRDHYAASLNQVDVPNWAVKVSQKINKAVSALEADHFYTGGQASGVQHRPDPVDVARQSGVPYSKVKRFLDHGFDMLPQQRFSFLGPVSSKDIQPGRGERVDTSDYGKDPSMGLEEDESQMLSMVWQQLDRQQQEVMSARFGLDGAPLTLKDTAEKMKLSVKQVRLIESKGMVQIRQSLEALED